VSRGRIGILGFRCPDIRRRWIRRSGVQKSDRESPSELLREGNPNPTSGHLSRDSKTIRANTRRPKAPSDSKVKKEDAKRAEVKKKGGDLWTPNSLKQTRSKQPLDTDDPTRTQLREAKAPSRERKNRRRSHRILSKKWCKIIGFLLVLSTFTISMLFCKHGILNATGATSTFCENRKNRESKYRSFLWTTAQFRKNIERHVGHGNILKVKKK